MFPLRLFPWTRRMQWGQPYWSICVKVPIKKWFEVQKWSRRTYIFSKNSLSSKCSPRHLDCIFEKPTCFMFKVRNWWSESFFLKKTSKNSSRIVKLSFDKPAGFFAESPNFFCSKSEKWWKGICSFFPKELLKKFPRTRRMPFWQPWWSVFAEKPKCFAVNERKWWKI